MKTIRTRAQTTLVWFLYNENCHPHQSNLPSTQWNLALLDSPVLPAALLGSLGFFWLSSAGDVRTSCGHRSIFTLNQVLSSSALCGHMTIETTFPDLTRTRQGLGFVA